MIYVDQSANALKLSLLNKYVDKSFLDIICENSLISDNFIIDAGIIGASHYCQIKYFDFIYSEIFACVSQTDEVFNNANNLSINKDFYKFKAETIHIENEELFSDFINIFKRRKGDIDLKYVFESINKCEATTIVKILNLKDSISVSTLHAYPNEMNIVTTLSVFDKNLIKNKEY